MASPLGWFRRHQKGMMVVFGVVLMAIFGLGSVAMMINPQSMGSGEGNEVAVEWDGGKLTRMQLDRLRERHFAANRFLNAITIAAAQLAEEEDKRYFSAAVPIMPIAAEQNINVDQADRAMLERYLMAEMAAKEGIRVDDQMVNDYIAYVINGIEMTDPDLQRINQQVNYGNSLVEIKKHLQIELAAQQFQFLHDPEMLFARFQRRTRLGVPSVPNPTEAAEAYQKLNRRIECSVMAVDVDDYISKVTETPSTATLKKLFNDGQYRLSGTVESDIPAFKLNKRAKVNFMMADRRDFIDSAMNAVTDAEVQAEYDRLVKEENMLVMEIVPREVEEENEGDDTGGDDPAPNPNEGGDAAPAPPGGDEGESNSDESEESTQAESQGDENKESGEETQKSSGEEAGEASKENAEKGSEGKESGGGEGASLTLRNATYVSFQEDETKANEQENKGSGEQESGEESKEEGTENSGQEEAKENSEEQAEQSGEESGEQNQAEGESTEEGGEQGSEEPGMLEEGDPGVPDDIVMPGDQEEQGSTIELRPKKLDEMLAKQIRESMVAADALKKLDDQIRKVDAAVRMEQIDYIEWESLSDKEKEANERPTIDLDALSKEFGLSSGKTELLDFSEMMESNFGKRVGLYPGGRAEFARFVFNQIDKRNIYEPDIVVEENSGITYVWWLEEKKDTEILDFNDAKDRVVDFWKLQEAKKLALAQAEKIADEVNSSDKKLLDLYPNEAKLTGSFVWLYTAFTQPSEVEAAGDTFMSEAFGLEMNKAGAAMNETGTKAYVIQKLFEDETQTDAELAKQLLDEWTRNRRLPQNVVDQTTVNSFQRYRESQINLEDELNVKWLSQ